MNWEVRTMKLKVSFCNKTVLRTDITRYAPLWGGYSLMLAVLVLMFLGVGGEDMDWVYTSLVVMFSKRAGQMALINGFYALFVAQALWGDLLAPRMCNSLHAMPVTRDGYFGAHLVAALLFALVPNVLVYGIAALLVPSAVAQAALLTLGAACLQYIFYLGAALVSVQLAGNRVGMVLAYGLVNFLVILLYWFCSEVFVPLIYGLKLDVTWITRICPTVAQHPCAPWGRMYQPVVRRKSDGTVAALAWSALLCFRHIPIIALLKGKINLISNIYAQNKKQRCPIVWYNVVAQKHQTHKEQGLAD